METLEVLAIVFGLPVLLTLPIWAIGWGLSGLSGLPND
jgi:hypothetical protein